jgi:hypothetical protein
VGAWLISRRRWPGTDRNKSSAEDRREGRNQMKLVKLTMLAATAAIAGMAFIGASSASATPTWIAICGKLQLLNCENKWLVKHPLLGRLIALAGPGAFNAGFVTIECASGEGNSTQEKEKAESGIESQQNKEFKGTLEKLTFAGCKGCTGVAVKTPQAVTLSMMTETGEWLLEANGAKVKFTGCPLSQSCTYEGNLKLVLEHHIVKEPKLEEDAVANPAANPKGAEFTKVALESTSLCAEVGKWEKGLTLFDWELDDKVFPNGTKHEGVTPSLIGANLIKKLNELGIVG